MGQGFFDAFALTAHSWTILARAALNLLNSSFLSNQDYMIPFHNKIKLSNWIVSS